jgi:mono/diheme cytochrome c family protein
MRRKNIGLGSLVAVLAVLGGCLPEVPASGWRSGTSGSGAPGSKGGSDDPSAGTGAFADGLVPEFGTTVRSADPPPPLSGGTIAMAPDGKTIVAADPDRDLVYVVDYHAPSTLRTVALYHHDEPGRVVVDTSNRAHVALRRAGAFVTIDLATATVIARRDVCSAPRGIAHDPDTDLVHVACAGGEIVTFPAGGGPELRRRFVTRDLRDVVAVPGALIVSTFRDARTYRLDDATNVALERYRPQNVLWGTPAVAWRMVALPGGKLPTRSADDDNGEAVLMAAQRVPASGDDGSVAPAPPSAPAAYYAGTGVADPCHPNGPAPLIRDHFACQIEPSTLALPGLQLTSVVFADDATVIALSREPAALVVVHVDLELDEGPTEIARIPLSAESREDTGHAIFHSNTGFGVACASCHPDGRDDGHSWKSIELGARRTPSLLGTLAGTAPYHWSGEAPDLTALMKLTFQSRMHGPALTDDRFDAIGGWLRALPAPPVAAPTDAAAAIRGQALFEGAAACSTCHSGTMRTNNATLDVSTGGAFQVPSLIGVSWRSPFLHDGSAPTVRALLERSHGRAALGDSQMHDLEAYVATF